MRNNETIIAKREVDFNPVVVIGSVPSQVAESCTQSAGEGSLDSCFRRNDG